MAVSRLDGEKICEVSGQVKLSSVERIQKDFEAGSIALFKLSNSYYVHAVVNSKRLKFQLKPISGKIDMSSRDSKLTLSLKQDITKRSISSDVSIHLKDAAPHQLQLFIDSLKAVEASFASPRGKLSSFSSRENDIQDIENKPLNSIRYSNLSSSGLPKQRLPLRSNAVSTPSSLSPNRPSNFLAKQMNPPSSHSFQKAKTPLHDQTRARDNLHNTSISVGSRSASSFYGSQNFQSPSIQRSSSTGKSSGPRLMPIPLPQSQTPRLSIISFRSHNKKPFEKEVALTGFSNLGNTCYMNAILQSLLGIPPFVQDLSNKVLLGSVHPQCLYKCLYNVMLCKSKCGNAEILRNSLRKLKRTISEAATRFSGYHQHDAHEFLCQVFDQLRDDVIACNSPSSKVTFEETESKASDSQCPVTRTFESRVLHTVSCKQCGETTPKEEIYHAFSIDIPTLCNLSSNYPSSLVNMQTLIKKHFEDEELEYACGKCESKEAIISHSFIRLPSISIVDLTPRVLILHLKRYGYDNFTEEQEKKQDKVNIERFIALEMMCSSNTKSPLPFHPKSSLQLSPVKSRQRPQKRHYVTENDVDDDDDDFQPSPSVRRKLDHSFRNTQTARTTKEFSADEKENSDNEMEITEICKLDTMTGFNSGAHNRCEQSNVDYAPDDKENNVDSHLVVNRKPVWEASEEQQMEWALAESTKSAEKKPKTNLIEQNFSDIELECTEKLEPLKAPLSKDSSPIKGECPGETSDQDYQEYGFVDGSSDIENPVWARSEEEQVKWALAESSRLSAQKKARHASKQDGKKSCGDWTVLNDNIMYAEDSLSAAWDSEIEVEPRGLKGGGPIATESRSECVDDNSCILVNNENRSPQTCMDSGLDKNLSNSVLKNSSIICIKRKNGHLQRKRKIGNSDVLTKTPTLGLFEGNLFDSETKDGTPSKFNEHDMEKAINMSLQDQEISKEEDEDLKRALELSLQDFEKRCPEVDCSSSSTVKDVTGSEKGTDSTPLGGSNKTSTHSYRLVSIVNHLGTRSTSGHYISDVYDCNTKQWTSYDDSTATKVTEHSVRYKRQQSGYIFFYMYKQCVDAIENSSQSKEN